MDAYCTLIQRIILATFNDCLWDRSGFAPVIDEPFNHDIVGIYWVSKGGMFAAGRRGQRARRFAADAVAKFRFGCPHYRRARFCHILINARESARTARIVWETRERAFVRAMSWHIMRLEIHFLPLFWVWLRTPANITAWVNMYY